MADETKEQGAKASQELSQLALISISGAFLSFIVPVLVFLIKKDGSDFFNANLKRALNFQITFFIIIVAANILLSLMSFIGAIFMMLICPIFFIINLTFCILATIKINEGKDYYYPFAIPLVK